MLLLLALTGCDLGASDGTSLALIDNPRATSSAAVLTAVPVKSQGEVRVIERGPYFGITATVLEKRDTEWFIRLSEVTEGWFSVDHLVEIHLCLMRNTHNANHNDWTWTDRHKG